MVASIQTNYSNKKGIYRDLYREIDSDKKKKKLENESSQIRKPKKGIYVEIYKQIEFKNDNSRKDNNNLYILAFKKLVKDISSKIAYFFSAATGVLKMFIVALLVAKKPINNYIENNLPTYDNEGSYYNGT